MPQTTLLRFMQPLMGGRRAECFDLMAEAVRAGNPAETLLCDVVWPAMAQVQRLYDDDRINAAVAQMAARINRAVADQLQPHLPRTAPRDRRVLVTSADSSTEELGAQIIADLCQSGGWETYLLGSGVPDDEILATVGQLRPHALIVFGAIPDAVANTRSTIGRIREIGTCPTMNIIVAGGIFARADGLWQEIGADACAATPREAFALANELPPREANAAAASIVKKRRRKRKAVAAGR